MPPKSKRQAKDEESSSSSSSEESESSSDGSVEKSAGWGAYITGNTRISDTRTKVVKSEVLAFPVCMPSFNELGIVPVQVATGARHTLVLGSDKKVYGWGCNLLGQLGLNPKTVPYTYTWVHVKALATKRICKLACGHSHSLGLTELGMVFSWGSNTHAQLGTTLTKAWRHEPLPVPKLCLVKGIACGGNTSFAFEKEDGDCFVWGDAKVGHAGVGEPAEDAGFLIEKPMKISTFEENEEEVQEICASEKHFVARSGQVVYVSGDGEWGRLGRGGTDPELVPVEIALPEPVPGQSLPTISCSQDATYFLSTVKSKKDGKLHSQLHACGRIGPSSCETVLEPTNVTIPHGIVTKVEGGKGWQMLVMEGGAMFYWGKSDVCGNMGTLARHCNMRERRTVPQELTILEDKFVGEFTCGDHYTIAFVDYDKSENKEHEIKVPVVCAQRFWDDAYTHIHTLPLNSLDATRGTSLRCNTLLSTAERPSGSRLKTSAWWTLMTSLKHRYAFAFSQKKQQEHQSKHAQRVGKLQYTLFIKQKHTHHSGTVRRGK